jgi:hypothetical protein
VGSDQIKLVGDTLTHRRYGGSSSRWRNETSFGLDPFSAQRTDSAGYQSIAQTSADRWEWTDHGGVSVRRADDIDARSAQTWSLTFPTLELPPGFGETGWERLEWMCGGAGGMRAGEQDPGALAAGESIDESFMDEATRGPLVAFRSAAGTLFVAARSVKQVDQPILEIFDLATGGASPRSWVVSAAKPRTSGSSPQLTVKQVDAHGGWRIQVTLPQQVTGVGLRLRTKDETWRSGSLVNGRVFASAWHFTEGTQCVEDHGRLVAAPVGCPPSIDGCPEGAQ